MSLGGRDCYTGHVRGDSVRDLYAKGLALVGLGVLAGVGALVDYWPTGVVVPTVAEAIAPPDAVDPAGAPPDAAVAPVLVVAAAASSRPTAGSVGTPPVISERPPALPTVPVQSLAFASGAVVLTAPSRRSMPAVALTRDAGAPIELSTLAPVVAVAASPRAAVAFYEDEDEGSAIAGAFKRTGSSIVRAGTKTGSSIVGAVKSFGAVVRRVLPSL